MSHNYAFTMSENPARICTQSAPTFETPDFFGIDVTVRFLPPDNAHDFDVLDNILVTLLSSSAGDISHPCASSDNIG